MKISRIIVQNYRSIENIDITLDKFSLFVGQNNHGKTNFFEAIEWFYNSKSSEIDEHINRDVSNTISVEVFYDSVDISDINKLKTEANRTKIKELLSDSTTFSVKKTSVDHKRKYIVNNIDRGNPSGLDTAINEFLPRLEYVNTKINMEDVSKYKDKNPIGAMLSGVLTTVIENSVEYAEFKSKFISLFENDQSDVRIELDKLGKQVEIYLQKQFPDGTKIKFMVNPPIITDLLKSFNTIVDDGIETKAEDKGDGMQRAIMLSIIQAYADYRKKISGGGNFLFMIDEAEIHLHPSAQRMLKKALLEICDSDQVLVNTHSSVLIVSDHDIQKIFKVEKTDKKTGITEVSEIDKINIVFDLLGGSPADLLLPRNFIITEGKSEFEFLRCIIKRFYSNTFSGIKILYSGGDIDEQEPSLLAVHKLFSPLAGGDNPIYKERVMILIDKPNSSQQSKYTLFKDGYPYLFENNQVLELNAEYLEGYYPTPYTRTKEETDLLQTEGKKVAYAKEVAESITQESFERDMPILYKLLTVANNKSFNPR